MTKKENELLWRLKELPTGREIAELVAQEVITTDEARKLLFTEKQKVEIRQPEKEKALEEEVSFLRKVIDELASSKSGGYVTVYNKWKEYQPIYPIWYTSYTNIMSQAANYNGISTSNIGLLSSNIN